MSKLSFDRLRNANQQRADIWNAGAKWDAADRITELCGEQGELGEALIAFFLYTKFTRHTGKMADISKKLKRIEGGMVGGDPSQKDALMSAMKKEAGDAQITLDLFCMEMGIDLGQVTAEKFNETSKKHGLPVSILCNFDADGLPIENELLMPDSRDIGFPVAGTNGRWFIDSRYLDEPALLRTHGLNIFQLSVAGGLTMIDIAANVMGLDGEFIFSGQAEEIVERLCFARCAYAGCPSRKQRITGGPCAVCYE